MAPRIILVKRILRLGLAAVFLYAAIGSISAPNDWVGYLPPFATKLAAPELLLKLFTIYEILLGLWLLTGKFMRWAGILSALTMLGIIASDTKLLAVTFRDIAVATSAIALAILSDQ
jgi:uncharacterized membrane protein YphA (DoxX/SURF4 family)